MEQNDDTGAPMTSVVDDKKKNGNGLKIATAIACIVAACGIGFGVYGMMQSLQKDNQIDDLRAKLERFEATDTDKSEQEQDVPDGYIAVFHGGVGERTYETYIYKDDNDNPNYGFTYINTRRTTKTWGSSEWRTVITERGSFDWTDEAFSIAKENSAYSYVTIPDSDQTYTIEEFQEKFLMN